MKSKKNVLISINPEDMDMLSPEAVKAGIKRRAASAHNLAFRRRMMTAGMLVMSVVLSVTVGAFAAATPAAAATEVEPEPVVVLCYEPGVGPWDITKAERNMLYIAATSAARGEDSLTIQAVAQSIRNACEGLGMTVEDVLKEFKYPVNCLEVSDDVRAAVDQVVDNGIYAVNADIRYFYNPAVQDGTWHEEQTFICEIGSLRFFA